MRAADLRGGVEHPADNFTYPVLRPSPSGSSFYLRLELAEHGNGGADGVFSGSWVKAQKVA
ncbi:MAG TPA: hypothetical protein VG722_00520 [Tepidisphaeraceae bacterium]|nr:hypothetical protein [Tepidisphaeraceae bacterium]